MTGVAQHRRFPVGFPYWVVVCGVGHLTALAMSAPRGPLDRCRRPDVCGYAMVHQDPSLAQAAGWRDRALLHVPGLLAASIAFASRLGWFRRMLQWMNSTLSVDAGRRAIVAAPVLWIVGVSLASAQTNQSLDARREAAYQHFASQVKQLADWCDGHGLQTRAAATRRLVLPRDPYTIYLGKLSPAREPLPPDASAEEAQWYERFWHLRSEQARELFSLAQQAIRDGRVSLAFELIHETVRLDPDHAAGRRLLGYQQFDGKWLTPYAVRKQRAGQVWHPRFGWLPRKHVEAYEAGKRFLAGRWVDADEEAAVRHDMRRAWRVETEHFIIRTNHSLEAGVALGEKLEALHRVWWQLFVRYFADAAQLQRFFRSRRSPLRSDVQHRVVYFRNLSEYQQAMRPFVPDNVKVTSGIYLNDRRTAYFFHDKQHAPNTVYHEATHQLFAETRPVSPVMGLRANFWVVEGVACYMESFAEEADRYRLGGRDAVRLSDARFRALRDKLYIPLAELVKMGREEFQHHPQIAKIYSQSAGLAHFLMHDAQGAYRDALVAYLLAVYTGRDRPQTLAQLTGLSFEALDSRYHAFLRATAPRPTFPQASSGGRSSGFRPVVGRTSRNARSSRIRPATITSPSNTARWRASSDELRRAE